MMEYDNDALEEKRQQLIEAASEAIQEWGLDDNRLAETAVAAFARLTPPQKPENYIQLITLNPLTQQAQSIKPGNLLLNWRKLIDIVPDTAIAAAGASAAPPWLLPFIALYIWNKIWCGAKEKLSQEDAVIIMSLWKHRASDTNTIDEAEGFRTANATRVAHGLTKLQRSTYDEAVTKLLRMGCIEMKDGKMWLREWVRVKY